MASDDATRRPPRTGGVGRGGAAPPDAGQRYEAADETAGEKPDKAADKDLLDRHVAGDPDAFGELVRRHRDRLWAVALRTLGDREEAADAVQDALISAYRAAHTFRGRSAVTTWLHRITVNACLDRARKAASRRAAPTDDTERLEQLLEPEESAAGPVERDAVHRELVSALSQLPAEQRAALVLVDMQGYPVAEAAEVLEVAVGTVKSRCARGRARLLPLVSHLRPSADGTGDSTQGAQSTEGTNGTKGGNPTSGASVPAPREGPRNPPRTTTHGTTGPGAAKGGGQA